MGEICEQQRLCQLFVQMLARPIQVQGFERVIRSWMVINLRCSEVLLGCCLALWAGSQDLSAETNDHPHLHRELLGARLLECGSVQIERTMMQGNKTQSGGNQTHNFLPRRH